MKRPTIGTTIRRAPRAAMGGGMLLLAFLLLMLFPFGSGDNGDSSEDSGPEQDPRSAMVASGGSFTPVTADARPAERDTDTDLTDDERRALSGDVLSVLIDEYDYLLEITADDADPIYRQKPLERIVELAGQAVGDSNGIRVRIIRRDSARASAEAKLKRELEQSGIGSDAIHMTDTTLP